MAWHGMAWHRMAWHSTQVQRRRDTTTSDMEGGKELSVRGGAEVDLCLPRLVPTYLRTYPPNPPQAAPNRKISVRAPMWMILGPLES